MAKSFNNANPSDVFKNSSRAKISTALGLEPSLLPGWNEFEIDSKRNIVIGPDGNPVLARYVYTDASGTENLPGTAIQFAYDEIASRPRPSSNQYFIFRMMTGTGKSTIVPVAWMLSGAYGPFLMTQPRRQNVISVYETLATYAGEFIRVEDPVPSVMAKINDMFNLPNYEENVRAEFPNQPSFTDSMVLYLLKKTFKKTISILPTTKSDLDYDTHLKLLQVLVTMSKGNLRDQRVSELISLYTGTRKFSAIDFKLGKSETAGLIGPDPYEHAPAPKPKILIVSEGWLIEKLMSPDGQDFMRDFHTVAFDEAHERTADFDLLYALNEQFYPSANVLLLSATLDVKPFLTRKPRQIFVSAPSYKITTLKLTDNDLPENRDLQKRIINMVIKILKGKTEIPAESSIIAFVPTKFGAESLRKEFSAIPDFGHIVPFDFTAATDPAKKDASRNYVGQKIIFATNAGETGITFKKLNVCIDSGLQYSVSYDPIFDCETNATVPIFEENMIQRRGRAGRVAKGWFVPLYDPATLKKNARPKIFDIASHINIHRMMLLFHDINFKKYNQKLLDPLSDIAIYNGLANLYQSFIIRDPPDATHPFVPGPFYFKRPNGNIRYLAAAALSRESSILFIILYALSTVGIVQVESRDGDSYYTEKPFGSDHLQLVFWFCHYLYITRSYLPPVKLALDEILRLMNYNLQKDQRAILLTKAYIDPAKNNLPEEIDLEQKIGMLRLDIQNALSHQAETDFAAFRRCMFLSHEDKVAEKISNNEYVWRGLTVVVNNQHATSTVHVPPKIASVIWNNLHFDYKGRPRLYFVAAPPRVVFTSIAKSADKNHATITMITGV